MSRRHGYRVERRWLAQVLEGRGWAVAQFSDFGVEGGVWYWWASAADGQAAVDLGEDAAEVTQIGVADDASGEAASIWVCVVGQPANEGETLSRGELLARLDDIEAFRFADSSEGVLWSAGLPDGGVVVLAGKREDGLASTIARVAADGRRLWSIEPPASSDGWLRARLADGYVQAWSWGGWRIDYELSSGRELGRTWAK